MLYFAIERLATDEIQTVANTAITVPSFMTSITTDGQEVIPVFLSRLHGAAYLAANPKLGKVFNIVRSDHLNLATYQDVCMQEIEDEKKIVPWKCRLVIDLYKKGKELDVALLNKMFSLNDVFFNEAYIRETVAPYLGEYYQNLLNYENLDNNEILKKVDEIVKDYSPSSFNQVLTKLKNTFTLSKQVAESHIKQANRENVGTSHVFVLKSKEGLLYSQQNNGLPLIITFVNKLDATIVSLFSQSEIDYEVVKLTGDMNFFNILKKQYQRNLIKFSVVLGFMGISNKLGSKWAKQEVDTESPGVYSELCFLSDIEDGYDLTRYFSYIEGDKEREQAMLGLIKTNLTPHPNLVGLAKQLINDMNNNTVIVPKKEKGIYPRLVFAG